MTDHVLVPTPDQVSARPDPGPPRRPGRVGPRRLRTPIAVAVTVAVTLVGLVWFRSGAWQPHLYHGTVLQSSEPAPPLSSLTLVDGSPVDLGRYRGDVVLVFFGYTDCPDVCPTTLSRLSRARAALEPGERDRVHVLMVTVDPERDPARDLERYVDRFDPTFAGVSGPRDALERVASTYGIFHRPTAEPDPAVGTIDHTASITGIDGDGSLRIVWAPDVTVTALVADLEALL